MHMQTRGCKYSLELLMLSGMPLETCWAFNERWNNKWYYNVASCWLFLLSHTTMHRSMNIKFINNPFNFYCTLYFISKAMPEILQLILLLHCSYEHYLNIRKVDHFPLPLLTLTYKHYSSSQHVGNNTIRHWHIILTHCGRVTQISFFNTVKLGTSASSP